MTYALIPGAGGSAWYWHRVAPLLPDAIAIDLPADDDSADLTTYADTVLAAVSGASQPLFLIAQSAGAFTAPMVASRVACAAMVLVNPMVPTAGEPPGQWWAATGHKKVVPAFDPGEDFFHDVPTRVIQGSDDRLFPLDFQRQIVRSRLGLELEVMPGGHLMALSRPDELAARILSATAEMGADVDDGH